MHPFFVPAFSTSQLPLLGRLLIAAVWLGNGLFAKVLNLVPRHREIVARILGGEYAALLTTAIGGAEILMAAWILSKIFPRLCAVTQIILVAIMNLLEVWLAPDLLLFGKGNLLPATLFIGLVAWHAFAFSRPPDSSACSPR